MAVAATFIVKLDRTQTGQTLKAKIFNSSDVQQGSDITTGFAELGNGEYRFTYASFADNFDGYVAIYIGAVYQASAPFKATSSVDLSGITGSIASLQASLAASTITVLSPFDANSADFTIQQGDDYSTTLGNRITWQSTTWPSLTGATAQFSAKDKTTGIYDIDGVVMGLGGVGATTQYVYLSLGHTATQALAIGVDKYAYTIESQWSGSRLTLATGSMTVTEDIADRG